ncbi:MAG TPA: non-ribosomal peptide synthetase, partial [Anaerolineae bacterium]|nr:non-ribosomal peptide synthetase [Anaerolineae bacterium]
KVGIYDNFFDLGGHSLLLVKVHTLLQNSIQTDLPMVELFRYPTINALAEYLHNGSQKDLLQKSLIQGRKQRKMIKKRQQMLKNITQKRRKKIWR